jgi:hypothetical protein
VSSAGTFEPNGVFGREVFFDSLTMFVFFLLSGRWLELRLRNRTAGALEAVMNRLPDRVRRLTASGAWEFISVRHLAVGDVLQVLPGEAMAADGTVLQGQSLVDEALLTGESRPLSRGIGSGVIVTTPDGQELFVSAEPPKGKKLRHLHIQPGEPLLLQPREDTDSVWHVSRDTGHGKDTAIHPTMKPVELVRKALMNSTLEGQIVLDMFSGSGSTIMGAEQTRRVGYAVELDPLYADASIRRWQNMTGKAATHAKTQKTFDATAKP